MKMGDLSILVWNAGGLNSTYKRASVLSLLCRKKVDIALLQETHLLGNDSKHLANRFYQVIASSSVLIKTRGVATLTRRSLPIKVLDIMVDTAGRFEKDFYDSLTQHMLELTENSIVVGADMNAVWDSALDRSHARASRDQELATDALRSWVQSLGLVDVWQSSNPGLKDFSFFSHRH